MDAGSFGVGLTTLILLGALYMLPALIARGRKRNATAIAVLNIFAGWTGVGWLIALVWACCKDDNET